MNRLKALLFSLVLVVPSTSVFAQNHFEDLISESNSLFEISNERLEINEKLINSAFQSLNKSEKTLEAYKESLNSHGYDTVSFFQEFENIVKKNGEKTDWNSPEFKKTKDYQKSSQLIKEANRKTDHFFAKLDAHIQNTLDVTISYGLNELGKYLNSLEIKDKNKIRKLIDNDLSKMDYLRKKYLENKKEYGKGKDTKRTSAYFNFFTSLKGVYEKIDSLESPRPGKIIKLRQAFLNIYKKFLKVGIFIPLSFDGIRFLKAALFPTKATKESLSLNKALNKLINKISHLKKIKVKVEDAHLLPPKFQEDTINIYTPSHRNALYDQITLAKLGVDNMVLFGAPDNFIPKSLNKFFNLQKKLISRLDKNNGFIVVGPGASQTPIEKALKLVKTSNVRSFAIFAGGRLPEGLGATMGVRDKFSNGEGLIQAFQDAGFKVNIVPISMRDNATTFDETKPLTESKTLRIRVGQNINDSTRKALLAISGSEALNNLLRYALIEDLVTDSKLIWGQVRSSKLKTTIDSYIKKSKAPHSIMCTSFL